MKKINNRDYGAMKAKEELIAKISKAMPPQAHIYMKTRQKIHQQVKKFIREDRG